MSNQRTKGQHYVPRVAYLEHFADQSQQKPVLWVYPVQQGTIDTTAEKSIPPKKLCKETYIYERPGLPVNYLEQFLARVESAYRRVLTEKILRKQALSDNDKITIALFISTLEARMPGVRDKLLQFLSDIEDMVRKIEEQFASGEESEEHKGIKKARNTIFADYIITAIDINRWRYSSFLFLFNETLNDSSAGDFFITSDQPVTQYDFTMMNNIHSILSNSKDVELIVPLTPKVLLFANNRGLQGYDQIHPNFVMEANNRTATFSGGRIISPHRLNSRMIDRYIRRHRQSFILQYLPDSKKL